MHTNNSACHSCHRVTDMMIYLFLLRRRMCSTARKTRSPRNKTS